VTGADGDRLTALVTGASAGIGAAFAREFARNGFDLVLVARREDRLKALAAELEAAHPIRAHVLPADLSRPEAPAEIFQALAGRGLRVDALVSNAGYGVPGLFHEVDWPRHRDCLQVMVTAPVHLAWLAAPEMARRGKGYILNVGSVSGLLPPHAGGTLYYPVKAFVIKFSLAHAAELRGTGVHVTALCPGFTHTEFQEAAGGTVEKVDFPKFLWMDAEEVARRGFRAVMRGDPVCVPGFMNRLLVAVFKYLPDRVGRWLIRVTG
jgi:short-subunit dehydrogenase